MFIERLSSFDAALSSFTLLELCGAASFRLSPDELEAWLLRFTDRYRIHVLDLHGLTGNEGESWWSTFVEDIAANISKKMSFGDAVLLREAENYAAEAIVTWNIKDFSRRTRLAVLTPTAFLRRH